MNKEQKKIALVTGVSTGIGYDLTRILIDKGYLIYGSVRNEKDGQRLESELGENYRKLVFDVTDYKAIENAYKTVENECPDGIDFLVNNAGMVVGGPLLHVKIEDFEYQFKVNLFGLMKVTQTFAPLLGARSNHQRPPGKIIQISSVSGKVGMPFVGPYASSKHALEGLSETLRRELLLWGIDVIVIGPGAVKTPIWNKNDDEMASFGPTPYAPALKTFGEKLIRNTLKTALESQYLCNQIAKIMESRKPKPRYTFMARKFTNYTLPRILPTRMVDRIMGKMLGFVKK